MMSDVVPEAAAPVAAATESKKGPRVKDLSGYVVGGKYEGVVTSAKAFGVFVKLPTGNVDALLPRSVLSKSNFDKLKGFADAKSKTPVEVEILTINAQNQTISAKYLSPESANALDLGTLDPKELKTRTFDATILSTHDFGVFAKIEGTEVDGLIPASLLPERPSSYT